MKFHEIRYFVALCETLNFTRAAERCNVTQPALTRAIMSLEDKLDAGPLVHRERNNTHLTELGLIMRPYLENLIEATDEAKNKAQSYGSMHETQLKIGLMCTIGPARLIDLFSRFTKAHPAVSINLVDGTVADIEDQLARGELDVAIYARPTPIDDRFHALPLFEERFMVAVAPTHPLAAQEAIRMVDLNKLRYLGRSACEFLSELRRIRLKIGGIDYERPYTSDRDDWVQSMVMAGLGFTFIPEFAVALPDLVARPLIDPEVRRTVHLVTVRGRPHPPSVGAFLQEIRKVDWAGRLPPPAGSEFPD